MIAVVPEPPVAHLEDVPRSIPGARIARYELGLLPSGARARTGRGHVSAALYAPAEEEGDGDGERDQRCYREPGLRRGCDNHCGDSWQVGIFLSEYEKKRVR